MRSKGQNLRYLVKLISSGILFSSQAGIAADDSLKIDEIVVTAQKRSESLQDASISLDVLSSDDVAEQGIKNAVELQDMLPAVKFVGATTMTVSIRGLGTTNINPGVDSAVAYSQDGIYLAHPGALSPVLYDLARVEAVLGPQGTLYGRNSNGGVINFISNNPDDEFSAKIALGAGNYNSKTTEGMINIPLSETLSLRVAGGSQSHDPYNDDGSNDADSWAVRAKLLYIPSDETDILFSVDTSRTNAVGNSYGGACVPYTDLGNPNYAGCIGVDYDPWSGSLGGSIAEFSHDDNKNVGASLEVNHDLSWAALTSLTGYRNYKSNQLLSPPSNSLGFEAYEDSTFITQELRLSNSEYSEIKWVAGLYYSQEDNPAGQIQHLHFLGLASGSQALDTDYTATAVFGDLTYPVTDEFRIRAGIRYTDESKEMAGANSTWFNPAASGTAGIIIPITGNTEIQKTTWKIGFDYDLSPENLVYGTVSTGFKSGGFNLLPASDGFPTYEPEFIKSYELGTKNTFMDSRLRVNASIFHYDYENYQAYFFYKKDLDPNTPAIFPTVNSQKSSFEGAELAITALFTANDVLDFKANLLNNEYDQFNIVFPNPVFNVDHSGNQVGNSPDYTYTIAYEHVFNLSSGNEIAFNINTKFVDGYFTQLENNPESFQDSYHQTNLSLSYKDVRNNWSLNAFVRNLEDEAVINSVAFGGFPADFNTFRTLGMLNAPRTAGLVFNKAF